MMGSSRLHAGRIPGAKLIGSCLAWFCVSILVSEADAAYTCSQAQSAALFNPGICVPSQGAGRPHEAVRYV